MVGSFNPSIFHPMWFAKYELIANADAEAAEVRIVSSDFASFSTSIFDIAVAHDKFVVSTERAPFGILRDLATGVFTLLDHTPIKMMGINLEEHYRMSSADLLNTLGFDIVPPDRWRTFMKDPAMRSVIIQGKRTDGNKGLVVIRVEPSTRVSNGVFFQHNDHFDFGQDASDAHEALVVLRESFDDSIKTAQEASSHILDIDISTKVDSING